MRSIRLRSTFAASRSTALAALAVGFTAAIAACSSAPQGGESSPIYHPGEGSSGTPTASSGGGNGDTSGGSTSSSSSGGSSSGVNSSGGTSSSSGSSSGAAPVGNTISADTTWASGYAVTESVIIAKGVTVTIAPGAAITVSAGVTITVEGTLTATTSTTHASLTGTGWTGLVIVAGGTLNADSLDIMGATTALNVAGTAEYDHGTITSSTPFSVTAGALTTKSSAVVTPTGVSSVTGGTFTASYLNYASGALGGLTVNGGTASITDSIFIGTPNDTPPDMITSEGPSTLTMLYTEIAGRHCSFHFDAITSFDLENLNVHDSDYGFMMWGSSATAGTRVVKNSNFDDQQYGIHEEGTNGAISVTGCYFSSTAAIHLADQEITIESPATAALTNVGPRPQTAQ